MSELKKTPLYLEYQKLGAKTIDFGGWDLPVQFSSIKEEHKATRTKAGLFDVSHMGEIVVQGEGSLEFLQKVMTNDISKLVPNRAQYTAMCYEDGGTIDDLIVYMLHENYYLLVVNAANTDKDYEWLVRNNTEDGVSITNVSNDYVQLALQGPEAESILQTLTETDLAAIKFFRFDNPVFFKGIDKGAIVSRTGYTGENGFEIYIQSEFGAALWKLILAAGEDKGLVPVGLGARDTLRFEANLALYGQELSKDITPIEAGISFAVKVNKGHVFNGMEVLKKQIEEGPERKLAGIEMIDKGIPRHGYEVFAGDQQIGFVTSGTQSPTLNKNVGLVLIQSAYACVGTEVTVQVRKRRLKAVIVGTPFYQRAK